MDGQDKFVSPYINDRETIEFFNEGLKQAASAARQLAKAQNHPIWHDISTLCDEIHNTGIGLSQARSLGRQKTLKILDHRETVMAKKLDATRAAAKPKIILN